MRDERVVVFYLGQVVTEAKVGHDSLARVRGLDTQVMDPHEAELLVGWALSRHANNQLPAAEYLVCTGGCNALG
jgi:hypothetical protein